MPVTFHLKRPPTVPLEAEVITPDVVANLLVGGHDTTGSQIGCTLLIARPSADTGRVRQR